MPDRVRREPHDCPATHDDLVRTIKVGAPLPDVHVRAAVDLDRKAVLRELDVEVIATIRSTENHLPRRFRQTIGTSNLLELTLRDGLNASLGVIDALDNQRMAETWAAPGQRVPQLCWRDDPLLDGREDDGTGIAIRVSPGRSIED